MSAASDPAYVAAWRWYRIWSWVFWAAALSYLPAVGIFKRVWVAIVWMIAVGASALAKGMFRCPRCGDGFFVETRWRRYSGPYVHSNWLVRHCLTCGLPKWAESGGGRFIRPCAPSDFDAIAAVINDAAIAYRGAIPDDRWKEPYMPLDELRHEFGDGVRFWGLFDGPQLLGVMGLQRVHDVALIRHAYTRTTAQGQGVGTQLLERLRHEAGRRPLLVGTWTAATWAVRFYERHGFRLVDNDAEKVRLLRTYWTVPDRQIAESVVLRSSAQ